MKEKKIKIESDFLADYSSILKKDLIHLGVKFKMNNPDEIIYNFLSVTSRLIPQIERKCFFSKGFQIPVEHEEAIKNIITKLEKGDQMLPYLSKYILNRKYSDRMFIHYGIYHFHLGLTNDKHDKRFIGRTSDLLFAYLDRETNNIYILGVFNHDTNWLNEDLVKIIYENWPDIFSKLVICETLHSGFEKGEREDLRKKNVNTTIKINDKTFLLRNAILTNSFDFTLVVDKERKKDRIKTIEKEIKENLGSFLTTTEYKDIEKAIEDKKVLNIKIREISVINDLVKFNISDKNEEILNFNYYFRP